MAKSSIRIVGFCCQNALSGEQGLAGRGRTSFEPTIKIVALPCSSKVETLGIIKAFEAGADGVFVLGCPDGKCHLLDGNYRAQKIVNYTKRLLDEIGIESSRLEMFQIGTPEQQDLDQVAQTMIERIESLSVLKRS
ncbi:MAG: hydrogenase iron-sulfur subunit [Pseudomonadota bacterium]